MLTVRTRKNVSLVLFIALLLVSASVWSMSTKKEVWQDGVYTGSAQGFKGTVTVELTVNSGKITDLKVLPHQETPAIADPAIESVTKSILESQSSEVDLVSGATYTSRAVIEASEKAIQKASGEFPDGTYSGSAQGFKSTIAVEVVVVAGAIVQIQVVEHDETPAIAASAIEQIPELIREAQSWEVEAISGATFTSEGIMAAVKDALD